ncbi:sulfide/dihydroorotate dehydrogenase-like FAD/NAD-binding protein [Acetonema longum]|uniref:Ferredoxin-NADP(+) reductase subunit alpha n=1 Tax=Acetonema longum DSM 6540 TaxID=1009370 RepID=F7NPB0_9FIRM|nr:sulfide/dihydroorotate dehydrogenase-like FAD/NAD-binding protein [Acetonema longum]EGO62072.1 ferredoxin-NADP(+) reductase subunit alpha [Acetonema longum DSM 6540]
MYPILEKRELSPSVKLFVVQAPAIAKKCQPGQFIILRMDEAGERIPLTIADFNRQKGTITLIFQEVGCSTRHLGRLGAGDSILDVAGPLGQATHIEKFGTVVCIGGGIGVAPVYPIARAYHEAGNKVISIIGARNAELLIMEDEMRQVSESLHITTDDGSKGRKGLVIDPLKELIAAGEDIRLVMAIGPVIMMKSVAEVTRPHSIKTLVSLNPIMVDGTGMCGGCRVSVANKNKFACVDGPEFDGHEVDFVGLMARQRMYHEAERIEREAGSCSCHH